MTERDGKADLISQALQFQLPQPMAIPVAPPAIGGDQKGDTSRKEIYIR
jgi:hypothetical protein